ncbi:MAG TPA: hypothetical protein PLS90_10125 [Candidatus Sumerlaeota bacterium]|nr:hypothetical protein [Candidatus Sumerlaeota bacterium]HOR27627.1 hypothetical protein [Candidatus Sumerlaeota bacterium]HPK02798.1 hypothetical protein [Candidatus Sumerlaeota bacterium]
MSPLLALVLYGLVLIGFGVWYRQSARDGTGFFLAGRALSAAEVGLSLTATGFGGSAILFASGLAWARGLPALWFTGSLGLGLAILGATLAGRVRAGGDHSLAGLAGRLYGDGVRWLASLLLVVVEVAFFALTLKSISLLTGTLLGPEHWLLTHQAVYEGGVCLVIVLYVLLGGHKAVATTDILQLGLVALVLIGILLPVALLRADWAALPAAAWRFPFSAGDPAAGLTPTGPLFAVNMFILMGLSGIVGGDVYSKILSARDERAARRGAFIGAAGAALLALCVALLALAGRSLLTPQVLAGRSPQLAIPLLSQALLHPVLFQLMVLGLLSALLSTADSVLITGATVLALDVLRTGERVGAARLRIVTLALALAGLALALWFETLLNLIQFAYTLLTASLVPPILAGLALPARRRPSRGGAAAAMVLGLAAAGAWRVAAPRLPEAWRLVEPATVGVAVNVAVLLAGIMLQRWARQGPSRQTTAA